MMAKETTAKIARLAGRFLSGELKKLTRERQLSMAGSLVAQAEREQESVKAWAGVLDDRIDLDGIFAAKGSAKNSYERVIPVLIRRVRPRADKAKARKRK